MLQRDRYRRFTIERHLSGQHFIQHDAHGIQIALLIRNLALRLLG